MERINKIQLWRQIGGEALDKGAELANTYDMPASGPTRAQRDKGDPKAVIKTASVGHLVKSHTEEDPLVEAFLRSKNEEEAHGLAGEQPESLPQMEQPKRHVDMSSSEPPKVVQEKKASRYALPSREMYPLDSYTQVKTASAYFQENYKYMEPEDRHEYCTNLVKRASELNLFTSPLIEKYGSATYAPSDDIYTCLRAREEFLQNDEHYLGMLHKLAAVRSETDPELFAAALEGLDICSGIAHRYNDNLPDAYYTTFGKTASSLGDDPGPDGSVIIGNEYITRRRLFEYLQNNVGTLTQRFGADIAEGLSQDTADVFDSLPRDQKLLLMRMANNDDAPVRQAVQTA